MRLIHFAVSLRLRKNNSCLEYKSYIIKVKNILVETNKKNQKIMIFGNGGSAAIASHFSVDLTKNAGLRCVNCNETGLITCFANDYGHENWITEAIKSKCANGDLIILISSSGKSPNIINAAKYCNNNKIDQITLSGFSKNNELKSLGNINFYVNFIQDQLFAANKYFNDQEPWKKKSDIKRLNTIVYVSLEIIRKISILLNPIIPKTSLKVLEIFNLKQNDLVFDSIKNHESLISKNKIKKIDILFKKIEKND